MVDGDSGYGDVRKVLCCGSGVLEKLGGLLE